MKSKFRIPHINGKKRCSKCKKYKKLDEFGPDKNTWDNKNCYCYQCERIRGLEKANRRQSESYVQFITARMNMYKKNAERKKINFKVSKLDLIKLFEKQKGKCALSKIKLTILTGKGKIPTNASLDRINPNGIYEIKNLRWTSFISNMMKQEMSDKQFKIFCLNLLKNVK